MNANEYLSLYQNLTANGYTGTMEELMEQMQADQDPRAVEQNIGMVTAYAYAVSKGFVGTEDEFAELMANLGTTAQEIKAAVENFVNITVPAAVQQVTTTGETQVQNVNTAGSEQRQGITTEGTQQRQSVTTAGEQQVTAINNKGTEQIDAVQAKGDQVIASIPAEYTALAEEVDDVKSALFSNVFHSFNAVPSVFQSGFWAAIDGSYNPSRTDYVCTVYPIKVNEGDSVTVSNVPLQGWSCYFCKYAPDMTFIENVRIYPINDETAFFHVPSGVGYIKLDITDTHSVLDPKDFDTTVSIGINNNKNGFDAIEYNVAELNDSVFDDKHFTSWTKGTRNGDGVISTELNGAASSMEPFTDNTVAMVNSCKMYLFFYDVNKSYIGKVAADGSINVTIGDWKIFTEDQLVSEYAPSEAAYFSVTIVPSNYTITSENVATFSNSHAYIRNSIIDNYVPKATMHWNGVGYFNKLFKLHTTHNGNGTYDTNNKRNAITTPLKFSCNVIITADSGYKFAYQTYDGWETGSDHLVYASPWLSSAIIPSGTYWCMIVAKAEEEPTDETTQDHLTFVVDANATDIYERLLIEEDKPRTNSYVVGSDSIKRSVLTKRLGELTYHQSFCMYDNKYYSTDGEHIGVQDDDFTVVSSKSLSVGHGNAFQLGHDGKAYISGWNDQKVYVVDMETLEINRVINLGTTGYTTAVIDDLNGIAYIFQRDSYPDTVVNYNFIVYDYVHEQVKSSRVINAFGAMQAADFYNGRIVVLWGLGTNTVPSGMAVYNTVGDILAEFSLDVFQSSEPEGIFFDRSTGELKISLIDKSVHAIAQG